MLDYKELIKNFKEEDFKLKRVNLHVHTDYSDGEGDFDELVRQAEAKNYKYIAITDHNTMNGYTERNSAASPVLIPGVEFDVWCGHVFMHLLAYGVDKDNTELKEFFAKNKAETEWNVIRLIPKRNLRKLIKAIHNAGGIAVWAHPACCWCFSMDRMAKKLISMGLDGIEVHYPYPRFRRFVKFHRAGTAKKIAEKYNLIKTGGTDCHKKILS
ncbi:hypothetical protein DBY21_01365 [Candidatus Gastranaerophilales bacterium]|nr:MAG: hypothetical protein DBY21_01365 [Candidatus Gastranaerophilales bacterium]